MEKLLLIALGGGAGSVLRYLLAGWVQSPRPTVGIAFPLGTLLVNVIGSLAIGVLGAMFLAGSHTMREEYRLLIFVGLLGGFTTYSAFSYETLELFTHGQWGRAAAYVLLTNALCLGAVWAAYRMTERAVG